MAIDAIDAAGKTSLADAIGPLIAQRDRPVVRASIDGFHRPRAERYRRGADSPDGYYEDAFDYRTVRSALLDPLGPAWTWCEPSLAGELLRVGHRWPDIRLHVGLQLPEVVAVVVDPLVQKILNAYVTDFLVCAASLQVAIAELLDEYGAVSSQRLKLAQEVLRGALASLRSRATAC